MCIYSLAVIFIIATTEQIKQLSAARKPHPLHVHLPFTPCDHTPSDSNLSCPHCAQSNRIQEFEIPLSNYKCCTRSTHQLSQVQQCSTIGHCKSSYLTSRLVSTVTVNSLVGIITSSKLCKASFVAQSPHTYAYPLTRSILLGLSHTLTYIRRQAHLQTDLQFTPNGDISGGTYTQHSLTLETKAALR